MTSKIVDWALGHRLPVLIAAAGILGGGALVLRGLPVDAFPDVSPVLVQVITESPGLAPEEVEALVTHPIEVAMGGLPGVTRLNSVSAFGVSQVNLYFGDEVDIYFARQLVFERVQTAREAIPSGVGEPTLGPITTGLGQVYQYLLEGPGIPPDSLRALQDWLVRPRLRTVPGVADVLSFGGEVRQFQVQIDPGKLVRYGVTLSQVVESLERNNSNAGGGYLDIGAEEYLVRGLGRVQGLDDIGNVIVAEREHVPVYVRHLGSVAFGPEIRRGTFTANGEGERVAGVVLKRIFENSSTVIGDVHEAVTAINRSLPTGISVVPFYDQSDLVNRAIGTVRTALLEGGVLIVAVLLAFLGSVRGALIVTTMLPASALLALILMRLTGLSANLMSLGGLAIGIGMLVDGGVVMLENIHRHLGGSPGAGASRLAVIGAAAREVARPILFAIGIIIVVFLPLLSLEGVEGKLFKPMALTITFAMLGSLVFSLTLIPVLATLDRGTTPPGEPALVRWIRHRFEPLLRWALRHGRTVVLGAVGALAVSLALVPILGTEFVPTLEEGSIVYRATLAPSAGLNEALRVADQLEDRAKAFPEVLDVVSKIGRAEHGGDPEPVNVIETIVTLQPLESWAPGRSKADLVEAMRGSMAELPGVTLSFTQPIAFRVDELLSGVRAELAIKLFGDDLDVLSRMGRDVEAVVRGLPGATDVQTEQLLGQPQLLVRVNREAAARLGVNVEEVQEVIRTAIGGAPAGQVFEAQRRFDVFVRYAEGYRGTPEAISRALVMTPGGTPVPLSQLASFEEVTGPKQVSREAGQRRIVVQANVEGRDLGGFVAEAQEAVARSVRTPPGTFITWGGQFENQRRAMARLGLIVPLTIALIFLLLFGSFRSGRQAALILLNVPFALIGGIVALFLTGQYLSVPASVGFIALFGVAVLNGVVLVSCINQLRTAGTPLHEAVVQGALLRLRPVLMTALVTSLGLVPLLVARGAGSEIQRPLATVVVGGILTATLLTLLMLPVLYQRLERGSADG